MIDMTRSDASQHPRGYQRACNARRRREAASWPGPLHPAAVERRGCPLDVVHDVDVVLVAHPQLVQLPPQALQPAHLRLCQATPEPHPPRPVASHVTPPRQAGAGAAPAPQPAPPVLLEADVPRRVTSGVPGTLAAQCRRAQVPGVVGESQAPGGAKVVVQAHAAPLARSGCGRVRGLAARTTPHLYCCSCRTNVSTTA